MIRKKVIFFVFGGLFVKSLLPSSWDLFSSFTRPPGTHLFHIFLRYMMQGFCCFSQFFERYQQLQSDHRIVQCEYSCLVFLIKVKNKKRILHRRAKVKYSTTHIAHNWKIVLFCLILNQSFFSQISTRVGKGMDF